ncbi:MAG: MlaA family lipoprotein [Desulfobacterales bacterium]
MPADSLSEPVFAAAPAESADDDGFSEFDEFDAFDEFGVSQAPVVFDPLSGYNRFMTIVNDHFYVLLFRPLAALYRFVVWEPVRLAVDRAFTNAAYPERLVNNLLQLKFRRVGGNGPLFCQYHHGRRGAF